MLWVLCPWGAVPALPTPLPGSTPYLVSSGKAAPTLVPRDGGLGLPGDHAVQIQGLPFNHRGGRGLDPDWWGDTGRWGQRGMHHIARVRQQ